MSIISEARYLEAEDSYEGWCTSCEDFTRDMTEPDAEGYDCPCCHGMTVVGTMNALLMGLFDIGE